MLKGKSGNVDLLYCLSGIMATRNTLVVVVVMIMTRTTIITRLQELFAINITDGAAFFPAIFFFFQEWEVEQMCGAATLQFTEFADGRQALSR